MSGGARRAVPVQYGSLPFREQVEFFRQKQPVLTQAWTDVYAAEHDNAWMVAGAARADLLRDFRDAVDKAIAEGTTLREFRKDFDAIVERHGWSYNGGPGWRSRVIYETNLRTSYAAGREAQMADPELRKRRPFGLYRHGGSEDPRPEHLALDGLVLPLDDPFWEQWTPPNGWGCKCKKFMVSQADVDRMGLQVADKAPEIPTETRTVGVKGPSPRTVTVPKGIDPGFEYRPGATRAGSRVEALTRQLLEKSAALSPDTAMQAAEELASSRIFQRFLDKPEGLFALAVLPREQGERIGARSLSVMLSPYTVRKQKREHGELLPAEYGRVQRAALLGKVVQDTPKTLVHILDEPDGYVSVVKSTKTGGAVFLESFRRLSRDEMKRDREVRRLLDKAKGEK